jgi:hypothetical protein
MASKPKPPKKPKPVKRPKQPKSASANGNKLLKLFGLG